MTTPGGGAATTLKGEKQVAHPHIKDEAVLENLEAMKAPSKSPNKEANEALFADLQQRGFIDEKGNIDFTKLGLSEKQIQKSELKGFVSVDKDGNFHYTMNGKCGQNAVKALEGLRNAIEGFQDRNRDTHGSYISILINPGNVATPSPEDLDVLSRGGQIQYRPGVPHTIQHANGDKYEVHDTVKLTLDPGKNGTEGSDGLTVEVFDSDGECIGHTPKTPLDVVFKGKELDGQRALGADGQGILPNYQELLGNSNTQAGHRLWSAAMNYLNTENNVAVGTFSIGRDDIHADKAQAVERQTKLENVYKDLNDYLSKPRGVDTDGLDRFIARLNTLKPEASTPEGDLLNYLGQLKEAIADPTRGMPPVPEKIPPDLTPALSNLHDGLNALRSTIAATGKTAGGVYQGIKTANDDSSTLIGKNCPKDAVTAALGGLQQYVVNELSQRIKDDASDTLSKVDIIGQFGKALTQVELNADSAKRQQIGQELLDKLVAPDSPWHRMAVSKDSAQIAELKKQIEAFENNFPDVPVSVDIKAAIAGPTAVTLDAFYKDLKAYLGAYKDVTAEGVKARADRLRALKPRADSPEAKLLDYLGLLQQAIANPSQDLTIPAGMHEVFDVLSNLRNGLKTLKNAMEAGGTAEARHNAIQAENTNAHSPIGQFCPTAAVTLVLDRLQGEAVTAMAAEIDGTADVATLTSADKINEFGRRLAALGLTAKAAGRNPVGVALLAKLTADPGGPWRNMAKGTDGQRRELDAQKNAFQNHFANVIPDLVPAAPADKDAVKRGADFMKNDCMQVKAISLTETGSGKLAAKAQLERLLQAYDDVLKYIDTLAVNIKDHQRKQAIAAIKAVLERDLSSIDGISAMQKTKLLKEWNAADVNVCRNILGQCINACS
jgi:hypothetical protein